MVMVNHIRQRGPTCLLAASYMAMGRTQDDYDKVVDLYDYRIKTKGLYFATHEIGNDLEIIKDCVINHDRMMSIFNKKFKYKFPKIGRGLMTVHFHKRNTAHIVYFEDNTIFDSDLDRPYPFDIWWKGKKLIVKSPISITFIKMIYA